MSTFDKDTFRKELLDALEPIPATRISPPPITLSQAIFAVVFIVLIGWVTADIWAAVHYIA